MQICLAIFDLYCLIEAAPGSKHSRNFGISFLFVYSGNQHGQYDLEKKLMIDFLTKKIIQILLSSSTKFNGYSIIVSN